MRLKKIINGDDGDAQGKMHLARGKEYEQHASERDAMLAMIDKIVADLKGEAAVIRQGMLVP